MERAGAPGVRELADLTPRARWTLAAVALAYTAVVVPIGIHKGGDVVIHLGLTERLLAGEPVYAASPEYGVWWPPFTLFALTPFAWLARVSLPVAKGAFAALNVACLVWALARSARLWGWTPALVALAAVAKPLQGNFEHLNLTIILLALLVAGAADLAEGRPTRAGAWVGVAAAVKGFPAVALAYFAYRRHWRGLAAGAGVAAGLTLLGLLPYGIPGAGVALWDWVGTTLRDRAVYRPGGQPLMALAAGLGGSTTLAAALAVAAVGLALVAAGRGPRRDDVPAGLGAAGVVAVLASPVAWFYYHTLYFVAWVGALARPPAPERRRPWVAALAVAGLFTSGALTFVSLPAPFRVLRTHAYVWGALLLLVLLALRNTALFEGRREQPR